MKEFDRLCNEFEEANPLTYSVVLAEKAKTVIPALCEITRNGLDGLTLFAAFIVGAVVSDGELSVEEFELTYPLFRAFFGDEISYGECDYIVGKMRRENKQLTKYVNEMVDAFGQLSEELKNDIVIVCLMICAIDGKISTSEKRWIKKLLK